VLSVSLTVVAGVLAGGLLVYLLFALLWPERLS
jgi:K+-transporting ATPase KdpF subunit